MIRSVAVASLVGGAHGHATVYEPPSRGTQGITVGLPNCAGGSCLWFNNGAFIGCPKATGGDRPENCPHPATPTIPWQDKKYGTIFVDEVKYCLTHPIECAGIAYAGFFDNVHNRVPWRYPGSAPVENPCGLNGGGYQRGPHGTGGEAFFGYKQGHKGTEVPPLLKQTTWVAGSNVEVAWGITANHGGGYQYRLCKVKDAGPNITAEVTEECFQKLPLEFVGEYQWIQYGDGLDVNNRSKVKAVDVKEGVLPQGSTWRRNPVPACNDIPRLGGHNHECAGPMFTPPAPNVWGFGPGACASGVAPCTLEEMESRAINYGIVDLVKVPKVPPGDYILSFRWECEQLPQVWSNCADVKIVEETKAAEATKPFSSWGGCEACCTETLGPCSNCTQCMDKKTGACEYCWTPLPGFTFGAIPQYQCLGYEGPDGGPGIWKPGMPFDTKWSPGCKKCWATKDSCKASPREKDSMKAFAARQKMHKEKAQVVV